MKKCQLQMKCCKAKLCFCFPLFLAAWVDFELCRILRALTPVLSLSLLLCGGSGRSLDLLLPSNGAKQDES